MHTTIERYTRKAGAKARGASPSAKGFTLIELMVAISIFAVVMVIAMGAVFTIIAANRKAQALASVIDNLNLAVESMTRTIKTNAQYTINGAGNSITVTDDDSPEDVKPTMTYFYQEIDGIGRIMFEHSDGSPVAITAPEVRISQFEIFSLFEAAECDQPMIAIVIRGTAGVDEASETDFALQTVISQRDLAVKASCVPI